MRQNAYGNMSPCPFGAGEWALGHLPVKERFFSKPWQQLRDKFLAGEKPAECKRCWVEEDAGKRSMRMIYLDERKENLDLIADGSWEKGPVSITIKTSNVCNLSCKTCWGQESSGFRREGEHYEKQYGAIGNSCTTPEPRHMPEADARQYAEFSDNVKYLEFFGGEPLMNKTHFILLEEIIRRGRAREISLFYSTNVTIYAPPEAAELWRHFKAVKMGLSIDGIHEGFHYMRWPGKFERIERNIQRYQTELTPFLNQHGTKFQLVGAPTVSIYNVYNIDETYDWLMKTIGRCYITLVQSPPQKAIVNIPDHVKPKIAEKLLQSPYRTEFQNLVNFMMSRSYDPTLWQIFRAWTRIQDEYRKVFFQDVYPEYYQLLTSGPPEVCAASPV